MTDTDLSATDYKIGFGTMNAFFWIWVKRTNFSKRKLIVMLILAVLLAVTSFLPMVPALVKDFRDLPYPLLLVGILILLGGLMFVLMSSIIMYVASPIMSYAVQVFSFVFGPMRRRVNSIRIDKGGLHRTSNGEPSALGWNEVHEVVATKSSILIFTNRNCAVMVPRSAFASREAADTFAQGAVKYWTDAKSVF